MEHPRGSSRSHTVEAADSISIMSAAAAASRTYVRTSINEQVSRRCKRTQQAIQDGSESEQQAAVRDLLKMTINTGGSPQGTAQAMAARLAMLQQPSALSALQQLLQRQGTALPSLAASLLSLLAAAGEQAAQQITEQPGMLPALAHLLQLSGSASSDLQFAVQTGQELMKHSAAAQRMAAEPAIVAGLLRVVRAAGTGESRTAITRTIASHACQAAFALHKLAALPGSSVSPEQQLSITAVPAGLLRSSRDWMMRQEGLGALMHMVQPVPVHAGDRAARQLAALPGFFCDVVQLLASTPAADEASAMRAIFVVRRLMDHDDHGSCRAEVIAQLAADKAAVAAIVRTMNCSDADFGSMTCEVFMLLARGEQGSCTSLWCMKAACRAARRGACCTVSRFALAQRCGRDCSAGHSACRLGL